MQTEVTLRSTSICLPHYSKPVHPFESVWNYSSHHPTILSTSDSSCGLSQLTSNVFLRLRINRSFFLGSVLISRACSGAWNNYISSTLLSPWSYSQTLSHFHHVLQHTNCHIRVTFHWFPFPLHTSICKLHFQLSEIFTESLQNWCVNQTLGIWLPVIKPMIIIVNRCSKSADLMLPWLQHSNWSCDQRPEYPANNVPFRLGLTHIHAQSSTRHSGNHNRCCSGQQQHATVCSRTHCHCHWYVEPNTFATGHEEWMYCVMPIIQCIALHMSLAPCRTDVRIPITTLHEKTKIDNWFLTSYNPLMTSYGKTSSFTIL